MPIRVEPSVDDPIVTFTFTGQIDPQTVESANQEASLLLDRLGTYYAILDIRGVEITFGEALALLRNPGSVIFSGRVTPVFVGKPVPVDPTDKFAYPVFNDLSEATAYIQRL